MPRAVIATAVAAGWQGFAPVPFARCLHACADPDKHDYWHYCNIWTDINKISSTAFVSSTLGSGTAFLGKTIVSIYSNLFEFRNA